MGWPYHFIDLTGAQKQERRELLDRYATLAQVSVLAPLLVIQCYFFLSWLSRRGQDAKPPASPWRKGERLGHRIGIASMGLMWRRFGWWCGEPVEMGSGAFYLGLRGEVLAAAGWLAWLLSLCFLQTGKGESTLRYVHI